MEGGPKSRRFNNLGKKFTPPFFLIVSSQTNIRNAIFDQRTSGPPEMGVSVWRRQTDRPTDMVKIVTRQFFVTTNLCDMKSFCGFFCDTQFSDNFLCVGGPKSRHFNNLEKKLDPPFF